ncbi:YndM family protein [Metaplanococcus flavidus]|uniref:YndM family protein n=1 Tax=Metaplanococcus flavidus TaxID=569883 RepID=A0ABW3LD04_9BACL
MNHLKALIIKFLMIAVVLLIILTLIFDVEFGDTLLISAVLTVAAYALGDLMIFRKVGNDETNNADSDHTKRNAIATVSDIVLAFLVIWLMGEALLDETPDLITAAIISALVIGGGEWFFHKYLDRSVFPEKHDHSTHTDH